MIKDKGILIQNIYYMLSYAYRVLQQDGYKELAVEKFDQAQDLFAAILSKGLAMQLKRGVSREYVDRTEKLSVLRGKIEMTETMRRAVQHKRQICCTYDELSENHKMNQILKTTAFRLIACDDVSHAHRLALKKAVVFLENVDLLDPTVIDWSTLQYHRHNASYRMLMAICYLVLSGLVLSTQKGEKKLAAFLDDQQMSQLYEKFILAYYEKHWPQYHPAAKQIAWDAVGCIDFLPVMQSDIMLTDGQRKLIIDAKYYTRTMQTYYEKQSLHSHNLYQIYAYVKNADVYNQGLVSGMLLYAKTEEAIFPHFSYNISGNTISANVLDLNLPFARIAHQLDDIIKTWVGYTLS